MKLEAAFLAKGVEVDAGGIRSVHEKLTDRDELVLFSSPPATVTLVLGFKFSGPPDTQFAVAYEGPLVRGRRAGRV